MKNILLITLAVSCLLCGCQSPPETIAYKTVGSIIYTVSSAKHLYDTYKLSPSKPVTHEQDAKIKSIYLKYQLAVKSAAVAEKAYKAGTLATPDWESIFTDALTKANELLSAFKGLNLPIETIK